MSFFFLENFNNKKLCTLDLSYDDINALRLAIEEFYYFEFVVDDIPIRGFVGQVEETNLFPHKHHIYVYTHHHFDFHVHDNQVRKNDIYKRIIKYLIYLDCLC